MLFNPEWLLVGDPNHGTLVLTDKRPTGRYTMEWTSRDMADKICQISNLISKEKGDENLERLCRWRDFFKEGLRRVFSVFFENGGFDIEEHGWGMDGHESLVADAIEWGLSGLSVSPDRKSDIIMKYISPVWNNRLCSDDGCNDMGDLVPELNRFAVKLKEWFDKDSHVGPGLDHSPVKASFCVGKNHLGKNDINASTSGPKFKRHIENMHDGSRRFREVDGKTCVEFVSKDGRVLELHNVRSLVSVLMEMGDTPIGLYDELPLELGSKHYQFMSRALDDLLVRVVSNGEDTGCGDCMGTLMKIYMDAYSRVMREKYTVKPHPPDLQDQLEYFSQNLCASLKIPWGMLGLPRNEQSNMEGTMKGKKTEAVFKNPEDVHYGDRIRFMGKGISAGKDRILIVRRSDRDFLEYASSGCKVERDGSALEDFILVDRFGKRPCPNESLLGMFVARRVDSGTGESKSALSVIRWRGSFYEEEMYPEEPAPIWVSHRSDTCEDDSDNGDHGVSVVLHDENWKGIMATRARHLVYDWEHVENGSDQWKDGSYDSSEKMTPNNQWDPYGLSGNSKW